MIPKSLQVCWKAVPYSLSSTRHLSRFVVLRSARMRHLSTLMQSLLVVYCICVMLCLSYGCCHGGARVRMVSAWWRPHMSCVSFMLSCRSWYGFCGCLYCLSRPRVIYGSLPCLCLRCRVLCLFGQISYSSVWSRRLRLACRRSGHSSFRW